METILMRVFEGAGISGLKGVPRESGDGIIRPILHVWKEDILEYLKEHKISYRVDKSNLDTRSERNWVRHVLVPLLEKRYGKTVKKRIYTLGERFRELDDYLETAGHGRPASGRCPRARPDRFDRSLAPTGAGLVRFDKPLPLREARGRTMYIDWILWGPLGLVDDNGRAEPGMALWAFNDVYTGPDEVYLSIEPEQRAVVETIAGRWGTLGVNLVADGHPIEAMDVPLSEWQQAAITAEGDTPSTTYTNMTRYVHALWLMLNQTITSTERVEADRKTGKAMRRARLPKQYTVIQLRRTTSNTEPGETHVEWNTVPRDPTWVAAPKACDSCALAQDRIRIAAGHRDLSLPRIFFAVILVFLTALLLPFALAIAYLAYLHLRAMGATNVKTLRDFLPDRRTHRYTLKTQVLPRGDVHPTAFYSRLRLYWIVNCTWYCPFSVALFEWLSYLTKAIENWWCPFHHGRKSTYDTARLDGSYWHSTGNQALLHPDDRNNPIWCSDADAPRAAGPQGNAINRRTAGDH